jgi:WD40 repeat protein
LSGESDSESAPRKRKRLHWLPITIFAVCVLAGVSVLIYALLQPDSSQPRVLSPHTSVHSIAVSADGRRVAVNGIVAPNGSWWEEKADTSVRVWDVRSGSPNLARQFRPRGGRSLQDGLGNVGLSPDGAVLAAFGTNRDRKDLLTFWSVETGHVISDVEIRKHARNPSGFLGPGRVMFTKDGKSVAFMSDSGPVLVRAQDGQVVLTHLNGGPGASAVYVRGIDRFAELRATKDHEGVELVTWSLDAKEQPKAVLLEGITQMSRKFAVSDTGNAVAVEHWSNDPKWRKTVSVFDASTGKHWGSVPAQDVSPYGIYELTLSADGLLVALGGDDSPTTGSVIVHRSSGGGRLHKVAGLLKPSGGIRFAQCLTFMPDGSALLYAKNWATVIRLDMTTGRELAY